jgi:hypothetical protein
MLVKCPICGKDGSLQQRGQSYNSVRVGHYAGYKRNPETKKITRIIEWHSTTIKALQVVNKGRIRIDENGKIQPLFTDCLPRETVNNGEKAENQHCLPVTQIMSLAPKPG